MMRRPLFPIRFADGGTLDLGLRTRVMGIINATPDSFSDGGRHANPERAVETALEMLEAGVELIDIGGESTRPGAPVVSAEEELDRVIPVVEQLRARSEARISIDTRKATVAGAALAAGADMVNDISGLEDPEMLPLLVRTGAPVVLMHIRGTPQTMQQDTRYDDLLAEVADFLNERSTAAGSAGVSGDKIVVDPGIGFGKSARGSLELLARLPELQQKLNLPILIGASRKSFIGAATGLGVDDRLEASLAVAAFAASRGAHIIRAHDAVETLRAVRMIDAIGEVGARLSSASG